MSFDVFLQSPISSSSDEERALAAEGVAAVLRPFLDAAGGTITTADGSAAIFSSDDLGAGFMVNHLSGEAIWDLLVEVARAAEFAILPVRCGTCIPYEGMRSSVPADFPQPVVVVSNGSELLNVIRSA
jgi:hypothetical protein